MSDKLFLTFSQHPEINRKGITQGNILPYLYSTIKDNVLKKPPRPDGLRQQCVYPRYILNCLWHAGWKDVHKDLIRQPYNRKNRIVTLRDVDYVFHQSDTI